MSRVVCRIGVLVACVLRLSASSTDLYQQSVRMLGMWSSPNQFFPAPRQTGVGDSILQSGLTILYRGGTVDLNSRRDNSVWSTTLSADSVTAAFPRDSGWVVLYHSGDSLLSAYCTGASAPNIRLLHRIDDPDYIASVHGFPVIVAGEEVLVTSAKSDSTAFHVHSVARLQRDIRYAALQRGESIVASTVNSDAVSIDVLRDGQSRSVGILPALGNLLALHQTRVVAVAVQNGQYVLSTLDLITSGTLITRLPLEFYEPIGIEAIEPYIYVVFKNGIVRVEDNAIVSADMISLRDLIAPIQLSSNQNDLSISDRNHVIRLVVEYDAWYGLRSIIRWITDYGLLASLAVALVWIFVNNRKYRRQLHEVLELATTGVSFVVDRNMRLRRLNSAARELFMMDTTTPLRRVLRYYCHTDAQRIVESFVGSAMAVRGPQVQKLILREQSGEREIIFTAQPLHSLTGAFDGMVVIGVDITLELERKRITNWAQLAHDMQTNLSIIKLNAEGLAGTQLHEGEEKRRRIVHQAALLLQRVRDIVSIGRDEQLHLSDEALTDLFLDVVREFDDGSLGSVRFIPPSNNIIARIDKPKMIRAVRNAVENSLRALRDRQGSIEFEVQRTTSHVTLIVRDDGVGMDQQTASNFFKPYFSNYRQFGGTGIGTMIMQRAIEIHGGTIEVQTAPNEGTTIAFKLPGALYVRG